jgi:predicted nucleic acid-binding protein
VFPKPLASKFSLGDALIAATALEHDLELATRNADDFKHVSGLKWSNPFDQAPTT